MKEPLFEDIDSNDCPTVYVERDHGGVATPVRMNLKDFNRATDKLHARTHRLPEGFSRDDDGNIVDDLAPAETPAPAAQGGKGRGGNQGGGKAPKLRDVPPNERYTINVDGKHYLADKEGAKLNETPFDTPELAAAAPITATE